MKDLTNFSPKELKEMKHNRIDELISLDRVTSGCDIGRRQRELYQRLQDNIYKIDNELYKRGTIRD